jgi:hypothetical protein
VLACFPVSFDSVDALLREQARGGAEQLDRVEQVAREQRHENVQLEVPLHASDRDGRVVADHLRRDLRHDLGDDRVYLAGHDRAALLQLGERNLRKAGTRAGAHQPQVVGDLRERDGNGLERARRFDEAVTRGLRLERIGGRGDGESRLVGEAAPDARREVRVSIQPGADGRAAERDLSEARQRRADACVPFASLRGVA